MTALHKLIEHASQATEKIFNMKGEVLPMWHCINVAGEEFVMPPPSPDKDVAVVLIRVFFELHHIVRYVYIDEAWTVALGNPDTSKLELDDVMKHGVRNHPDRQEVVLFSAEDDTGMLTASRTIIRPKHGRPKLGPLQFMPTEANQLEGRMVGLLTQRGTVQ
jgi:hypothetical protein